MSDAVYRLDGALTLETVAAALAALPPAVARGDISALDFAGVTHCDSAALALILAARRAAAGRALEIRNLPPRLADLAELYGVSVLLWA